MLRKIEAKVLIVDDLPENLLALRSLIQSEDRMVFEANSADDALSLLLEHEFALAILDVKMPGMNGFELAELMRGTEKTKHIPIIFVSAVGRDMDYAFRGYESGAVDFLHKPLSPFEVRSKVAMARAAVCVSVSFEVTLLFKECLMKVGRCNYVLL